MSVSTSDNRHPLPLQIAIIGGGLAGMSAAEAIVRFHGPQVQIRILEAKRVTGGRAGSFAVASREPSVDYCQHVAMGCCTNFVHLLQRCGLDHLLQRHRELTFVHPGFPPSRCAPSSILPAPLHLAHVLKSLRFLSGSQRRQIRYGMLRLFRLRESEVRGHLAGTWLREHGQADETIKNFWGTFVVSALGEEVHRVDMAAVRKVMVEGFAAARGASDVLMPALPLAELFGCRLPERLKQMGVEILPGHAVEQLDHQGGKAILRTSSGETLYADHVVSAVPWHGVERLCSQTAMLPDAKRWREIPSSAITGVHLWLDREITTIPLVVMVGTASQWIFRPPWCDQQSPSGDHYYQVVISASNQWRSLPKEALVQTVMSDLRHLSHHAANARLRHSRVVTDPHSVFSIRPEVLSLRPASSTPLPWFHLAGDWIDTGWPATMEGAVISGRMAANSIARQAGWEAVEIDRGLPRNGLSRLLIRSC